MIHNSQQAALIHLGETLERELSTDEVEFSFTARSGGRMGYSEIEFNGQGASGGTFTPLVEPGFHTTHRVLGQVAVALLGRDMGADWTQHCSDLVWRENDGTLTYAVCDFDPPPNNEIVDEILSASNWEKIDEGRMYTTPFVSIRLFNNLDLKPIMQFKGTGFLGDGHRDLLTGYRHGVNMYDTLVRLLWGLEK